MLEAALEYAARGWDVFPGELGKKKSHKSAEFSNGRRWGKTTDPDEIRRDFRRWPDANIGVVTGKETGIFVLDADTTEGHGVDGIGELKKLIDERGLPDTLMAESPSGSLHYYFRHPGGDIKVQNSDSKIAPGIDIRGDGGMVLAPPSIKPDVGEYKWLNDLPVADAPAWLIEAAREAPKTEKTKSANGTLPSVGGVESDNSHLADPDLIAAAIRAIPNSETVNFREWNRVAMAAHRATNGSAVAFKAFDKWSQQHSKYSAEKTAKKWAVLWDSPPTDVGAGTIFHMAKESSPSWREDYRIQQLTSIARLSPPSLQPERVTLRDTPDTLNATSRAADHELVEACLAVEKTGESGKTDVLIRAAFAMGQLIGAGRLKESLAITSLTDAAQGAGVAETDAAAAIASGIAAGRLEPRLPTIKVLGGRIAQNIDQAEAELLASGVPVFQRAGSLVSPIKHELPAADGSRTDVVLFRTLRPENLIYALAKYAAVFRRYDARKKQHVAINPPSPIASGLLQKGQWQFPEVTGVVTAPTMRPDGTILDRPGYDEATQLYYHPDRNCVIPPISANPTREEAESALELLEGLLTGFPFVSDVDRSVALAGLMTQVLRGAFDVTPMFLLVAPTAGTGKSHYVNLASTIATGRPCPVITNVVSAEEMEKRLGALVLEGAPIISLDNCSHDLGGDLLCQITEQRLVRIRILGRSEVPPCEWRGTLFANGNNITLRADMTRRGLPCHLDAAIERPETRTFDFDPVKWAAENRGDYIHAALTIARAYRVSGSPKACGPIGSYEQWSTAVREPLVWLGKEDPIKSMDSAREEDPARIAARTFLSLHEDLPASFTVAELIMHADEREAIPSYSQTTYEIIRSELHTLLVQQAGNFKGLIDSRSCARWLKSLRGQIHEGKRLVLVKESSGHGNRYAVEKVEAADAASARIEKGTAAPRVDAPRF
jgi:Bifunctional DNA primase/polymerase, N-terminal/Primase C terminal 2 (PriCT-2)